MESGFDDFAAAQAGGADADAFGRSLDFGVNWAQVDVPAALGDVVGVADVVTELRPFAADLANLCHGVSPERWAEIKILMDSGGFGQRHALRG
jgi:hypothetical protein